MTIIKYQEAIGREVTRSQAATLPAGKELKLENGDLGLK